MLMNFINLSQANLFYLNADLSLLEPDRPPYMNYILEDHYTLDDNVHDFFIKNQFYTHIYFLDALCDYEKMFINSHFPFSSSYLRIPFYSYSYNAYSKGINREHYVLSIIKIIKKEDNCLKLKMIPINRCNSHHTNKVNGAASFIGINPKRQKNLVFNIPYEIEVDEEWNKKAERIAVEHGYLFVKTGYETVHGTISKLYESGAIKNGDMLAVLFDPNISLFGDMHTKLGLFKIDYSELKKNYKRIHLEQINSLGDVKEIEHLDVTHYITDKFCFINKAHT